MTFDRNLAAFGTFIYEYISSGFFDISSVHSRLLLTIGLLTKEYGSHSSAQG